MRKQRLQLPSGFPTDRVITIVRRHGGRNPRVFGSFARGEGRADSDLDLLVDLEPGRDLFDVIALKQELEDTLGRPVDVLTEPALSPYLRDRILAEATAL
jgi:uncharacterized protein